MKALLGFLALLVAGAFTLHGEDTSKTDESVRALLRNSTLIIDADIIQPYLYGSVDEFVTSYSVRVHVRESLFGDAPASEVWVRVSGRPFEHSLQPASLRSRQRVCSFSAPTTRAEVVSLAPFTQLQLSLTVPSSSRQCDASPNPNDRNGFYARPVKGKHLIQSFGGLLYVGVIWFVNPSLLFMVAVVSLLWIGLPFSLLALVRLLTAIRMDRSRQPALTILSVVAACGGLIGFAVPASGFIQQRAIAAAKAYPARVAPLLEAYRQAHGSYPTSLDQLPGKPFVPRLLRRSYGYRSDGTSYSFSFPQPGVFFDNLWNYDSETQSWHLST